MSPVSSARGAYYCDVAGFPGARIRKRAGGIPVIRWSQDLCRLRPVPRRLQYARAIDDRMRRALDVRVPSKKREAFLQVHLHLQSPPAARRLASCHQCQGTEEVGGRFVVTGAKDGKGYNKNKAIKMKVEATILASE